MDTRSAPRKLLETLRLRAPWKASAWMWLDHSEGALGETCAVETKVDWEPPERSWVPLRTILRPRWTCGEDVDCCADIGEATLFPLIAPLSYLHSSPSFLVVFLFSLPSANSKTPVALAAIRIQGSLKWVSRSAADLPSWEANVLGTGKCLRVC